MKIKINRIAEGADIKLPARAHYNDAGADVYTTAESERLVRLPMYYGLTEADRNKVIAKVLEFYAQ